MKVPWQLHVIALIVVLVTLAAEAGYLFYGTSAKVPEVLIGRILGTLDAALTLVLGFYFTASIMHGRLPQRTTDSLAKIPVDPSVNNVNRGPTS